MPELKNPKHLRLKIEFSKSAAQKSDSATTAGQRFWNALPDPERTRLLEGNTGATPEGFARNFEAQLKHKLEDLAVQAKPEIRIAEVHVVEYGSMLIDVSWWGPDATALINAWVGACLKDILGPWALVTDSTSKESSVAGLVLERLLPIIPQRPASLLFLLMFISGLWLLWLSKNLHESLFERRTALLEKVLAHPSESSGAWQAIFTALSTSPKSTDTSSPSISNQVTCPSPQLSAGPPRAAGPSCCQLMAEAIRSTGVLPGAATVSTAAQRSQ